MASLEDITDKNLYAYCDNNPITRIDTNGAFWVFSVLVGLTIQYASDVIDNISNGETGWDIFKPTSSAGEYIAAGLTALIPGGGLAKAFLRSTIHEGITTVETMIRGESIDVGQVVLDIAEATVIDLAFEKITNKAGAFIRGKAPKNYSTYAHQVRKTAPNLTRQQITNKMQRSLRLNRVFCYASDFILSVAQTRFS